MKESTTQQKSLFQKVLGTDFDYLPPLLQQLHGLGNENIWIGEARTQPGSSMLAKLISRVIGLSVPENTGDAEYKPLQVTFERLENSEKWHRNFNGHCFNSHLTMGEKKEGASVGYYAIENFGLFRFELDLPFKEERLLFVVKRCTFLGVPLPSMLLPTGESYEYEQNGRFHFNVEIRAPLAGLIAAYDGWLLPQTMTDTSCLL